MNLHSTGIEPVFSPWKGDILPLNYECDGYFVSTNIVDCI